jgi:hypothetical protein
MKTLKEAIDSVMSELDGEMAGANLSDLTQEPELLQLALSIIGHRQANATMIALALGMGVLIGRRERE